MAANEQYHELIERIEKSAKSFFKYPGSAVAQYIPELNLAYRGITANKSEIEKLVELGVIPKINVGSRSQGSNEFSTNFCLDTFRDVGIVQPERIIEIVERGITPFHAYHMRKAGRRVAQMRPDNLLREIEKTYGKRFSPIKEIDCDIYENHFMKYSNRE